MKRKALLKDFLVEIKRTYPRFLSIMLIVVLGVAFFAGVRATSPDMKDSADVYFDEANFMDFRIVSELGMVERDLEVIRKIPGIQTAVGEYYLDVLSKREDERFGLHLTSLPETLDQVTVTKGHLPKDVEECFVDQKLILHDGYKIGDVIDVYEDTSKDKKEDSNDSEEESNLSYKQFKIVGYGNSPYYLSLDRGTTKVGNGSLSGFVMVDKKVFNMDVYTQIAVKVEGSKELLTYSDSYKDLIASMKKLVEKHEATQTKLRYEEVVEEATEKIRENEDLIEENKKKLRDGEQELVDAEEKIRDAKEELRTQEKKLQDSKKTLDDAQAAINNGWQKLKEGEDTLASKKIELDQGKNSIEAARKEFETKKNEFYSGKDAFTNVWNTFTENEKKYENEYANYLINVEKLQTQKEQLKALKEIANSGSGNSNLEETYKQIEILEVGIPAFEQELGKGKAILDATKLQLDKGEKELLLQKSKLESGEKELLEGEKELLTQEQKLQDWMSQYEAGVAELNAQKKKLNTNAAKLADGKQQYEEGAVKLADGKKELEEQEVKFLDGKETFEKESKDAYEKIAAGEGKIKDAKEKVQEIEVPSWHILDRETVQNYVEYGQDTDRIGAIGEVFPAIFFLVAALICLTTMTRMVEENRTQIGTLKALGYSKFQIAGKYVAYAFLATLFGSIIGFVLGQLLLPRIIINAYKIMYYNLPTVLALIHLSYSLTASILAIACTTFATILSCYKELRSVPAALMRPVAPKNGKRVFLEKVPFIWKRLNFSNKATVRNLIRYKKRFFMTVFGIGGCMGLLLVGYGLKDSIMAIGDIQFGEIRYYNSTITLKDDISSEKRDEVKKLLKGLEEINKSMFVYEKNIDVEKEGSTRSGYLMVPENKEELTQYVGLRNRITKEQYQLDDQGVIITEKLAKLLKVQVGDQISLKEDERSQVSVKVSHIVENYFYHYIIISPKLYKSLYGEYPTFTQLYTINKNTGVEYEAQLQNKLMKNENIEHVNFVRTLSERISDMLKSMDSVIVVLVVSAGLLAFVVLYNLNNVNISERKRELATLKVLGFYELEVSEYVFRENIWLTLIGCGVGVLFGFLLHRFVIVTAEIDLMMFGREIKMISYLISIGFTLLFSMLVNLVMHFKLKKINMVESMKSVE